MEEKNSQENAFDTMEPIKPTETAIDINASSEIKSDILSRIKKHRESIDKIIVPQYIDDQYVVTYSKEDNSFLGWKEENGQQQPDVYFKLDQKYVKSVSKFILYKKTLLFSYYDNDDKNGKFLF